MISCQDSKFTADASKASIDQLLVQRLDPYRERARSSRFIPEFCSFLNAPGTLAVPSLVVRCQMNHGRATFDTVVDKSISRWRLTDCFRPFLTRILPRFTGSADFLVLLSDNLYPTSAKALELDQRLMDVPLLRCDWKPEDSSERTIPIPDFHIQQASYATALGQIHRTRAEHAFEQRRPVVGWRGSLSGPVHATMETVNRFPRYKLLSISKQFPQLVDARLTNFDDIATRDEDGQLRDYLRREFGELAPNLPEDQFVAYRYLVSTDGAVAAWRRVPTILASGSVLLLQNEWRQFFYPGLKAWLHYVPVKTDLSDLLERHEWLEKHQEQARNIAAAGQRFADTFLTPAAIEEYFLFIVHALASS